MDHSTPVTVMVEEGGRYHVSILGLSGEYGLVDSRVEFARQVMVVEEEGPVTIIVNPTIATPTTLGMNFQIMFSCVFTPDGVQHYN